VLLLTVRVVTRCGHHVHEALRRLRDTLISIIRPHFPVNTNIQKQDDSTSLWSVSTTPLHCDANTRSNAGKKPGMLQGAARSWRRQHTIAF